MMTTSENVTIDGDKGEIVERTVIDDHGDGTATSTTYDGAGHVTGSAELTLSPPQPVDRPLDADLLATAEAARRAVYDAVIAAGGGVMSMARLRDADRAGSEAFLTALSS